MDVMQRLRVETRPAHRALEATALAQALARGIIDLRLYRAKLAADLAILSTLEDVRAAASDPRVCAVVADAPARTPAIRADLEFLDELGVDGTPCPGAPLDELRRTLERAVSDGPRLLGQSYVFEGSSIGGVILARALKDGMGLGPRGTEFLAGRGADTLPAWRAFGIRMNLALTAPSEQDRAIAGAGEIFAGLRPLFVALSRAMEPGTTRASA